MDVATVHQRHLARRHTMDICSVNRGDRVADLGHSHMRANIVAGIVILTMIVIGNLGGLWLVGAI